MQYINISHQQASNSQQQFDQPQDEEDETLPTPSSKKTITRGKCIKKMAKRNVDPESEPQAEAVKEPELFGDDALPHPPGVHRIAKSRRSSNSTASSGSNPTMFQEMLQQQYELDRKENMERIDREVNSRVALYDSQKVAEDLKVLQMSTNGMDPVDAAIINAQKARIRALYQPNN
nr:hypothetical protein [Tanacetum cinerariifolium]